jgi:hypothetical protein
MSQSPPLKASPGDSNTSERDAEKDNQSVSQKEELCRICSKMSDLKDIKINPLIHPCDCQEENSYAHKLCIDQRLEETKHEFCDICRFKFIMTKTPKTLRQWIKSDFNWEDFIELSIRTINLVQICLLVAGLWYYEVNPYQSKEFLKIIIISREEVVVMVSYIYRILAFLLSYRWLYIIYLWLSFSFESMAYYSHWKRLNFNIEVKSNPDFKARRKSCESKNPLRALGTQKENSAQN